MKNPAILFYTSDFITGTLTMTDAQRGKYIILLCLQHQQGYLTEEDMLNICKSYDEKIYSKFIKDDAGYFYNERMQIEMNKRQKYSESRSINRIGVDKSYVNHMENININEDVNRKEEEFRMKVFEFKEKYKEEMLIKFVLYWTEWNKSQTKMRYEMQPTFEISKRLATWASRDKEIIKAPSEHENISYKELVERFNKGETAIWEKYEPVTPGDKRTMWKRKN